MNEKIEITICGNEYTLAEVQEWKKVDGWQIGPKGGRVCIGSNVEIGSDVTIADDVKIGNNVTIGDDVKIGNDVRIGDDVQIGRNVTIGNDVEIGRYVTIESGTTVTEDILHKATEAKCDALKAGSALALARQFHDTYERLAPAHGYETRPETRAFDPDSPNGRLMTAVCEEIMKQHGKDETQDEV